MTGLWVVESINGCGWVVNLHARGTHCTAGCVGPKADFDFWGREKIFCPLLGWESLYLSSVSLPAHYTDWAIASSCCEESDVNAKSQEIPPSRHPNLALVTVLSVLPWLTSSCVHSTLNKCYVSSRCCEVSRVWILFSAIWISCAVVSVAGGLYGDSRISNCTATLVAKGRNDETER